MSDAPPNPVAVVVTVGPDDREVERLVDLADSVAAYERGPAYFVMVDDRREPRDLARLLKLPPSIEAVSLHHPRHVAPAVTYQWGKGICSAVLLALGWVQASTSATFVLKLDTDSLVIGPFRERLAAAFAAPPGVGMIGAYSLTPAGEKREWTIHRPSINRATTPAFDWRRPLRSAWLSWRPALWPEHTRHAESVHAAAIGNGYTLGEHCMGGGYAVSRRLLDRMASAGHFARPELWNAIDLPEDVMIGLHTRAVGLGFANAVGTGEVFGVRYRGLAFPPRELIARGYAVIHAVKNDANMNEADVRAFFKSQRALGGVPRN